METLQSINPMIWIIVLAATLISTLVLFNNAVKPALKLAVVAVMALLVVYFLIQAGLIGPPRLGS